MGSKKRCFTVNMVSTSNQCYLGLCVLICSKSISAKKIIFKKIISVLSSSSHKASKA